MNKQLQVHIDHILKNGPRFACSGTWTSHQTSSEFHTDLFHPLQVVNNNKLVTWCRIKSTTWHYYCNTQGCPPGRLGFPENGIKKSDFLLITRSTTSHQEVLESANTWLVRVILSSDRLTSDFRYWGCSRLSVPVHRYNHMTNAAPFEMSCAWKFAIQHGQVSTQYFYGAFEHSDRGWGDDTEQLLQ